MTISVTSARNVGKLWLIEDAILKAVTNKPMRTVTYKELGAQTEHPTRGPWKDWLDAIARKYTGQGLPDITFAVRAAGPDSIPGRSTTSSAGAGSRRARKGAEPDRKCRRSSITTTQAREIRTE